MVRPGVLFRAQQLAMAEDASALHGLKLARVVDFRGAPEKQAAPDPNLAGVTPVALPIFDDAHPERDVGVQLGGKLGALVAATRSGNAQAVEAARKDIDAWVPTLRGQMIASYETFVTNPLARDQFASFLRTVADGKVTLFHCVSGKDRTGFAAAVVLRGLGVSWKDVLADYLVSNAGLEEENAQKMGALRALWPDAPGHAGASSLAPILGVHADYLTASFAKIQEVHGAGAPPRAGEVASDQAIRNFIEASAGPGVLDALRAKLLTGAPKS